MVGLAGQVLKLLAGIDGENLNRGIMILNPTSFKVAVNLHTSFWENNMNNMNLIEIKNYFQVNHMNSVISDIANEYGLPRPDAATLVKALYIKSIEDLDSRFLCCASVYNFDGGQEFLENDLYNTYGYVVPYDIVCGLIVARKPLEKL